MAKQALDPIGVVIDKIVGIENANAPGPHDATYGRDGSAAALPDHSEKGQQEVDRLQHEIIEKGKEIEAKDKEIAKKDQEIAALKNPATEKHHHHHKAATSSDTNSANSDRESQDRSGERGRDGEGGNGGGEERTGVGRGFARELGNHGGDR